MFKSIFLFACVMLLSFDSFGEILFREKEQTFNRIYEFRLENNLVMYKLKTANQWNKLPLHKDIGMIKSIAADDEYLIVIDGDDRIFTMFNGVSHDEKDFKWTKRWGAPFWLGRGMKLPANVGWDVSLFSPEEDKYYQAFNGNKYKVGQGVTNIFYLAPDHQTIVYLDPWLPADSSYRACTPLRGRFKAVNISTSGSTIFLIGENGDMYTRLFDFDVAGSDGVFFHYSYKPEEYTVADNRKVLRRNGAPRPLPLPEWKKQSAIEGIITDRITIIKVGVGGIYRTLRVEGMDEQGNTGYYTKDISDEAWSFVITNEPLRGRILALNGSDDRSLVVGKDTSVIFTGKTKKYQISAPSFEPYCSPSEIEITLPNGEQVKLFLHTREKIRQTKREGGLTDKALKLYGTIEIPNSLESYSSEVQEFLVNTLKLREKFTNVRTQVTSSVLKVSKFGAFKWVLERKY